SDASGAGGAGGTPADAGADRGDDGAMSDASGDDAAARDDVAVPGDGGQSAGDDGGANPQGAIVWTIDNVHSIAGHPTSVLGAPKVIDTPAGKAVQFDGVGDAL